MSEELMNNYRPTSKESPFHSIMDNNKGINPWREIRLSDYESHMRLDSVQQLQTMNKMMRRQFSLCSADTVMILGVTGVMGWNTQWSMDSSECTEST